MDPTQPILDLAANTAQSVGDVVLSLLGGAGLIFLAVVAAGVVYRAIDRFGD
jgi:hypothetical protein